MAYKNKEDKLACQRRCYARNPQKYIDDAKRQTQKKLKWFHEFRSTLSCIECGENREPCIEFHHRNPDEKEYDISRMIRRYSKERIMVEIEKCDVLCRNCHAMRHWDEDTFHGRKLK